MMATQKQKDALPHDELTKLLDYDPETGEFTWKPREGDEMSIKTWNGRYAGKRAGYVEFGDPTWIHRRIGIKGLKYKEHQVAWFYMTGEWVEEGMTIDHKNRDATDNSWENLRMLESGKNSANMSMKSTNKSGISGVNWSKATDSWMVRLYHDKKRHYLGCYDTLEEAEKVVNDFREKHGIQEGHGQPAPPKPERKKRKTS
tara:strand:+ start:8175 stop:8777 length:603 start_codon:yes stop_codon:yes gene_type:complete